jgi:hypothetical protein
MADNNSQELVLWCTVHDESAQPSPFKVTISASADVGDLKEAIKKKNEHTFADFDAHTLVLWKVRSSRPTLRLSLTVTDSSANLWSSNQRRIFLNGSGVKFLTLLLN